MTINMASSTSNSNATSLLSSSSSTKSSTSTKSTSELTQEEKKYDIDTDGVLSLTEQASYLEAQTKQKVLEAEKSSSESVSLNISDTALKLQKQNTQSNISDTMTKSQEKIEETKNHKPENEQENLMQQAISEYKKFSSDNYLTVVV